MRNPDSSGWSWYIPLHDGTVSVGFVMDEKSRTEKRRAMREACSLKEFFIEQIQFVPGVSKLLANAHPVSEVQSASDYSYSAASYYGDHYRIVGDAGGTGALLHPM